MLLSQLKSPISVVSLHDIKVNTGSFLGSISRYMHTLPWDLYLYRQHELQFLNKLCNIPIAKQREYYRGCNKHILDTFINKLTYQQLMEFKSLKPTRKRGVATFNAVCNGECEYKINRIDNKVFLQFGVIEANNSIDYRTEPRYFHEVDNQVITSELLEILKYFMNKIKSFQVFTEIEITVHFTQIVVYGDGTSTNSPEGIHQDGMEYIVSALVVEYDNVEGAKSIIFGSDAKTPIFETTLGIGYGLFQPDSGTDLWHVVTPLTTVNKNKLGIRSTIGIDFHIIH